MNSFKKIASAVMAAVMVSAIAVPVSPMVMAETAVVQENLLAQSTTDISKMTFGKIANQSYTGKAIKPKVTVKSGKTTLKSGTDYTLTYKNNKNIGTASVTVKGKGRYTGSKTLTFSIVPAKSKLSVKTNGNKLTFSWDKVKGAAGYQIYYSVNGGAYKKLTSTGKTSYSTSKLKLSANSYSFKIRAYKKVSGKTYYGAWTSEVNAGKVVPTLDYPDLKVTSRIKFMSFYSMDENSAAAELFKKTYGVPKKGDDPSAEGQIFETINVTYMDRYDKLTSAIASDNSPDLFPFEAQDYPYGVVMGRYKPVDSIINLDSPKWENTKELMDMFAMKGKHYCAFSEIQLNNLMYYRTSMIKEIGAEDPRKLFEKGNWTWDTFLALARKWQDSGDNRFVIDGYNPENDIILSTGVPMVGFDGKQFTNNLYDPAIERAEELIATLQKENLRYPRHELNGWAVNPRAFVEGNTLFYADGGAWVWENTISRYATKYAFDENEVKCVPFPKDPQADKHYVAFSADCLMWCTGSKNKNGVKAWFDCCATAAMANSAKQTNINNAVENYKWSKDNIEFIYSLTALDGSSPVTPIVDYKGGLGKVSDGSSVDNPIQSLTDMPYLYGDSFAELREQQIQVIQDAIDEKNNWLN